MAQAAAAAKVLNFVEDRLLLRLNTWIDQLTTGELGHVEQAVTSVVGRLGDVILSQMLPLAAQQFYVTYAENRMSARIVKRKGGKLTIEVDMELNGNMLRQSR